MRPYYRLQHLIIEKYGEDKLSLGCQLVAQYVGLGSTEKWTPAKVVMMCTTEEKWTIAYRDLNKLAQLFHLQGIENLYTKKVNEKQHALATSY